MKIHIKNLFYSILFMLFVCNSNAYGATNLIKNGSFENGNGDQIDNWVSNAWNKDDKGSEFKTETGSAEDGHKFVTIMNNINNDARYMQKINVQENKIYKLSCYIKTDNISKEGAGACISIEGKLETSKTLNGTNNNWQNAEMYVKTGTGVNSITVTIGVGGYGNLSTGKASFDNVLVEEVSSIPENVIVSEIKLDNNDNKSNVNTNENTYMNSNKNTSNGKSNLGAINYILILIILMTFSGLIYYICMTNKNSKK